MGLPEASAVADVKLHALKKSVRVLVNGIEAVMVPTLMTLKLASPDKAVASRASKKESSQIRRPILRIKQPARFASGDFCPHFVSQLVEVQGYA